MRGRVSVVLAAVPAAVLPAGIAAACAAAPAPWQPLFDGRSLAGLSPTRFGGEGEVSVRDGAIVLEPGSPLTGFTVDAELPRTGYELEVCAARLQGHDFFCGLTFPVGAAHLTLVLGGWGGALCGLSCLDGRDAQANETKRLRWFADGREYRIGVQVGGESVRVTIDGEELLRADLRGRRLSLRPEVELSRPLGIASYATRARVRSLRWRPL